MKSSKNDEVAGITVLRANPFHMPEGSSGPLHGESKTQVHFLPTGGCSPRLYSLCTSGLTFPMLAVL